MWTRADLKARGKADFQRNYWACVLVSLILVILVGGAGGFTYKNNFSSIQNYSNSSSYTGDYIDEFENELHLDNYSPAFYAGLAAVFFAVMAIVFIISIVFGTFVANPLIIGARRFYLENQYEKGKLNRLGCIFKKGRYGNTVLTMFLKNLFISLWTLLFIIPGIVKSYSYWMIDYILAENPNISRERAFEISQRTMDGQKWDVFVLDLSFILWALLSGITCGLVGLFYVQPYIDATKAQLYGFLRMNALTQGIAAPEELPGYFPQQEAGY